MAFVLCMQTLSPLLQLAPAFLVGLLGHAYPGKIPLAGHGSIISKVVSRVGRYCGEGLYPGGSLPFTAISYFVRQEWF